MINFFMNYGTAITDTLIKFVTICGGFGICLGLWQYKHSVKIAKLNERRASVELAAKECTNYGVNLRQKITALLGEISKSGCDYLNHCKPIKSENGLEVDASEVTPEDREKVKIHIEAIVDVLNSLEGFAIPFAEGVADDRVGFTECGRLFVQTVEQIAPFYYFWPLKDYYRSSQVIYMRWRKQIEREEKSRKYEQASKDYIVMSAQFIKDRTESRFWQALANWCLEKAKK